MAKTRSKYVCQQCGYSQVEYFGKCPECDSWNSATETTEEKPGSKKDKGGKRSEGKKPVSLTSVSAKTTKRKSTKISELDRVLGGGLVQGQVILMAGEPGIGKSTILLQLADKLGRSGRGKNNVLYVSGEESAHQIKIRADRLGVKNKNINLMDSSDVDQIINEAENTGGDLDLIVIDSIQTMSTSDLSGMAGSVGQVKECSHRLVKLAKGKNVPIFIVGHVTKQGNVAGPAVLMHIVDTVLWFEGDKSLTTRMLRVRKNRFGPTDEVGVFSMGDKGLISLDNPEEIFLSDTKKSEPGSVVCSIMQGSRPILVEIQSLVVPSKLAYPKRIAQGIDSKRFELLLAVLIKRCGIPLYNSDCYVNVTGGFSVKNNPSADLAVCLSIAGSHFDKALSKNSIAIGEVGLLGDIREVVAQDKRVKEAKRLGYKNAITSKEYKYLREAIKKHLK